MINRDTVIKKIIDMPQEQVAKVLIFMAGMEAEQSIDEQNETEQTHDSTEQLILGGTYEGNKDRYKG